ncbi:MAG: AmmeMemoRadiSam system radical SAM enzyme [Nanoarchaeota archaeon]|nr:AmmeMemoRadiSam system radical SAM enzyme [Nanoarchaeota archaeon]
MEKEALFWIRLNNKEIQCQLCPHFCVLKNKEFGKCNVRQNKKGKLISLVYGKPCSLSIDPIEKKPLYHFFPGKRTLSTATPGCNMKCRYCQNWEISQAKPGKARLKISPCDIVKEARSNKIKIISYTYTEPTIFYEYMRDIAKIAKKFKIKNITVTNGFINQEPLKELCEFLDASNIDLKSMDDEFYQRVCQAKLKPVLESIKLMKQNNVWIEITNLLIPGLNDSTEDIEKLVIWIKKELGKDVPLHFTAFYPCYKLLNSDSTNEEILKKARKIAISKGLNYVYTGNIEDEEGNNTYCPKCKEIVIKRKFFEIIENKIKDSKCSKCGERIAGVWE